MSEFKEVLDGIEASNKAFAQFKASIEGKIMDLEGKEAKAWRPHMGGERTGADSPETKAQLAAFKHFVCTGDDREMKSLATTTGPDGGWAVPKILDAMIEQVSVNISPIRAISQVVQVSSPDYHKLVDVRGTSSGWVGESAPRPETSSAQFEDIAPPFGEIYCNIGATQTMLDDVFFNADQWISESAGTEFARAEGAAFVNGTGVVQPRGFLTYTNVATGDATRAYGQLEYLATGVSAGFKALTSTINPVDDLYALISKLKAAYRIRFKTAVRARWCQVWVSLRGAVAPRLAPLHDRPGAGTRTPARRATQPGPSWRVSLPLALILTSR